MADFQPPPTYAEVVLVDEVTGKPGFNPIWLNWFLTLAQVLSGGSGAAIAHDLLSGLQGGTSGEFYHLTSAEHSIFSGTKAANLVLAGPTTGAAAVPSFRSLVTADLANQLVTYAKIQNVTDSRLLGRSSGSAGAPMEITVGTGLGLAAGVLSNTATTAALITVANEATDTTCFPLFVTAATGDLGPKSNAGLVFNSNTADFTAAMLHGIGAGTNPVATQSQGGVGNIGSQGTLFLVNSTGAANSRIADFVKTATGLDGRFINDAYSGSSNWLTVVGNSGGPTTVTMPTAVTVNSLGATAGAVPGVAASRVHAFVTSSLADIYMVSAGGTADNKTADILKLTTGLSIRFINDAASAATDILTAAGGHGAGVSLVAIPVATSSVFGHTASVTVGNAGKLQVSGASAAASQIQAAGYAADATTAGTLALSKSRHATNGSNTIVQSGDVVGTLVGYGANGTTYTAAGNITIEINGTPGAATDMPGRIVARATPDGSGTPLEVWRAASVASAVNSLTFTNAATTAGPILGVQGSDTDIDINLTPKGAGLVKFGAFTVIGLEVGAGTILIKDAGGTTRKLLVVA